MSNKIFKGIVLATLPFAFAATLGTAVAEADTSSSSSSMTSQTMNTKMAGPIVGSFSNKDKTVVGATAPGKKVSFKVAMAKGNTTYLHFAFMHAASGKKGWFFAPTSDKGIALKKADLKNGMTKTITNKIGLFAAPDKSTVKMVTGNDGKLKYEKTSMFLKATVTKKSGKYVVTIMNNSKGSYKTPFSSGVWGVQAMGKKNFDHMPSMALSELATMGHRDSLLKVAQSDM